jgi:hypothetical protein
MIRIRVSKTEIRKSVLHSAIRGFMSRRVEASKAKQGGAELRVQRC